MSDLYHVTTERKAKQYRQSGVIASPVRGFDTLPGAMAWAIKTGRKVIYLLAELDAGRVHKLPDHHNQFGSAYWHDGDVPVAAIKCVVSPGKA